jgi:hypothetical protein
MLLSFSELVGKAAMSSAPDASCCSRPPSLRAAVVVHGGGAVVKPSLPLAVPAEQLPSLRAFSCVGEDGVV